jgi:hypothetical protein|tara:strand:- start:252 stop:449 length:198 start_codon:yes stop_codon:yes gene_type:complete
MDIIIFSDGLYQLVPMNYNFNFAVMDFFDYCSAFREALAVYDNELNRWVMKDGRHFFGCIANENY